MTNNKIIDAKLIIGVLGLFAFAAVMMALAAGALRPLITQAQVASSTEPVISNVAAVPNDTMAAISWTTDEPSNSQIAYGTTTPYSVFSPIDNTNVTSHSVEATGLTPGTTYHFEVISQDASSSLMNSPDQTFLTTGTASTTATGTVPMISSVVVNPTDTGATITWTTDQPATTQVAYGPTTSYGASTTLDSTLTTSHSATLSGLTSDTPYHFEVLSGNSTGMALMFDQNFMTTMTGGGTGGTTGSTTLQDQITALQNRVTTLEQEVALLLGNNGGGGGTGTTTPPTTGTPTIDQSNQSFNAGGSVDFGGRNFGHEETVTVMMGGNVVATAHADSGGNFSTGSLALPSTPGTYTYLFVGKTSGLSANATITLH